METRRQFINVELDHQEKVRQNEKEEQKWNLNKYQNIKLNYGKYDELTEMTIHLEPRQEKVELTKLCPKKKIDLIKTKKM